MITSYVCHYYITVWKSSLDNLEHQLKFNLQHSLVGEGRTRDFCIDNGIIYCAEYGIIRS